MRRYYCPPTLALDKLLASMAQPTFSNEIYSIIIDDLQADLTTLRQVSLVNKAFSTFSRRYIWRRVVLQPSPPTYALSSCAKLYEILTRAGNPAEHIRDFCIDDTDNSPVLAADIHLPPILNCLTQLTKISIFNMRWPAGNLHPVTIAFRNILRSTELEAVTIHSYDVPAYFLDDCRTLKTLGLRGQLLPSGMPQVLASAAPQPQHMTLDVDPVVATAVWLRVDTSQLQSLLIQLPDDERGVLDAFQRYGHILQTLGLNCMEDIGDADHLDFGPLPHLRQLVIAFRTWIDTWPATLVGLLEHMGPLMPNLRQVHLYLIVDTQDSLMVEDDETEDEEDADWLQQDFSALDGWLSHLHSTRHTQIRIALCPNVASDGDIQDGAERLYELLPVTRARNILSVQGRTELPWDSMFRS
ncbi:hypothetical protein DXG01_008493 [Tephrocybe rancida]|nr:hypothetical protein DXG01_008493 [Tephrocybe rancida]